MPGVLGPFVGLVELLGGLALFTGLLTRWAASALAVNMTVAVPAGSGVCALDNLIGRRRGKRPSP